MIGCNKLAYNEKFHINLLQNTNYVSKALYGCDIIKKQVEFIHGKSTEIKEDRDKDESQLPLNFQTCFIFIQEGKVFILSYN